MVTHVLALCIHMSVAIFTHICAVAVVTHVLAPWLRMCCCYGYTWCCHGYICLCYQKTAYERYLVVEFSVAVNVEFNLNGSKNLRAFAGGWVHLPVRNCPSKSPIFSGILEIGWPVIEPTTRESKKVKCDRWHDSSRFRVVPMPRRYVEEMAQLPCWLSGG